MNILLKTFTVLFFHLPFPRRNYRSCYLSVYKPVYIWKKYALLSRYHAVQFAIFSTWLRNLTMRFTKILLLEDSVPRPLPLGPLILGPSSTHDQHAEGLKGKEIMGGVSHCPVDQGIWGSVVSSPSWIGAETGAENDFSAFLAWQNAYLGWGTR